MSFFEPGYWHIQISWKWWNCSQKEAWQTGEVDGTHPIKGLLHQLYISFTLSTTCIFTFPCYKFKFAIVQNSYGFKYSDDISHIPFEIYTFFQYLFQIRILYPLVHVRGPNVVEVNFYSASRSYPPIIFLVRK